MFNYFITSCTLFFISCCLCIDSGFDDSALTFAKYTNAPIKANPNRIFQPIKYTLIGIP